MAKNIYENFDFGVYYDLLNAAKIDDIYLVHTFDQWHHKGGFTVAWQRDSKFKGSRMVNVAVSYCSPKDYFARKIGAYNALSNAYSNQFVQLPIGDEDSGVIVERLRSIFDVSHI